MTESTEPRTEPLTATTATQMGEFSLYRKMARTLISDFTVPPGTTYQTPEGLRAEDEETRVAFDVQGGVYPIRESVFAATYVRDSDDEDRPEGPDHPEWIDLAADIRAIDGNHDTGASSLAAALTARGWTRRSTRSEDEPCGYCGSVNGETPVGFHADPMTGDHLRAAISRATDLVNPRLSEVDWDVVAASFDAPTRSEDEPGTLDAGLLGLLERGKTLEARDLLRRRVGHLPSLDATRPLSDPTASEASDG